MTPAVIAARVSTAIATPFAIVAAPVLSVAAIAVWDANGVTFVLSMLSITLTQMILAAGAADTRALQTKLDELIRAVPDASDDVIGCETMEEKAHD